MYVFPSLKDDCEIWGGGGLPAKTTVYNDICTKYI